MKGSCEAQLDMFQMVHEMSGFESLKSLYYSYLILHNAKVTAMSKWYGLRTHDLVYVIDKNMRAIDKMCTYDSYVNQ
jgi:hypothetical protein